MDEEFFTPSAYLMLPRPPSPPSTTNDAAVQTDPVRLSARFDVKLSLCSDCVRWAVNDTSPVQSFDGYYVLAYYICETCREYNGIKLVN